MAHINVLDKSTVDKIAAGEVVDRPSSIVKEVLENAIDAKATAVTVEIKDGGISFIRITDNGQGIEKDDIKNAFLRHATSKIKNVEDLLSASSLGFRGEALSSIAAVTQLECITKTPSDLTGIRYVIEGGEEKSLEEVGAPTGTTFIIRNLFYNTPARRKFLKSATTEASYISSIVEKIALSHPEVSIRFINNNQNKLHTSGNNKLKEIIYSIYGRDVATNILEIDDAAMNMHLTGYIGKPIVSRGNRNNMVYFINGRFIKSKIINNAIEEAYKPYMMQHNYPFCVLHFQIYSHLIDVNVHPSKMEIRFENPMDIYNIFYNAISAALSRRELIPEVTETDSGNSKKVTIQTIANNVKNTGNTGNTNSNDNNTDNNNTNNIGNTINVAKPDISTTKTEVNQSIGNNNTTSNISNNTPNNNIENDVKNIENVENAIKTEEKQQPKRHIREPEPFEVRRSMLDDMAKVSYAAENDNAADISKVAESSNDYNAAPVQGQAEQLDLFDNVFLSEKERKKHKMIGQLFDTYWLIEYDNNLYIIDQHAAHEKVLYEKTLKSFKNKEITSQQINPPIILTLSMEEENILNRFSDEFERFGYEIEPFGGKDYAVRAVPANLYSIGQKELLMSLIDSLTETSVELKSDLITEKIASMSCKAAVKGNMRLSVEEANALIEQLLQLDNPYNCPHGRPTIISMSKYEIEKKFKRIV
ncbi:MAG: DNA mismatch repair endonuclease MutL [Lachnospiraceae bacterium]|nr:DNA mismatch repair endonuclease MutL [Clostridiales bacterium]MDD6293790.1 DNA mismatch repair endonuclease MutL [Eubacteriales bacterium]MDY2608469.1 DNA mismatch repair endonuclease MutL [Lachnospiraceae bacterium]